MTTSIPGVCPFATPIAGGLDLAPHLESGFVDMVGFCDHAAGGFYTTLMDPGFWQRQGDSVNFAIARDGSIGQILNLFTAPYGQGRDQNENSITPASPGISWPRWAEMKKQNPNCYLIATEHEDWEKVNGVARAVVNSQWTPAQYVADLKLKQWAVEEAWRVKGKNLLRFGIDSLTDHHMFDPVNRANCAGKYWRDEYRARLFADLTDGGVQLAKLNDDGSQRIVSEGNFIVMYNNGVAVERWGSTAVGNPFPGRHSKNFGGHFLWERALDANGNLVPVHYSEEEGD